MPLEDLPGRAHQRDAGLSLVEGWTTAIAVGALALTGVLGLAAADTFRGHNAAQAPPASTRSNGGFQEDGGVAPQPPPDSSFGGGSGQPPAVVSGGS